MKRIVLAFALVLALALPAQAEVNGVYAGIKFIDSIQSTGTMSKTKGLGIGEYSQNSIGGGIFVGYDFFPQFAVPLRTEIEYDIRTNTETTWDKSHGGGVKSDLEAQWNLQTLFFNVYLDWHNSTAFTPYVGAGIGMGFIDNKYTLNATDNGRNTELGSKNKMNTVFAWNVGVGTSYAFTENFSADLAYRFVGLGENEVTKTINGDKLKIASHPYANEFSLGLRYTF